ncbi:FkbM family methyltransferase [Histidinibacterium aquaticum]|uniref:FkbM family methyltransferase n=1 Tax=Histidinibacterium aquaticum TaxID=2613962 RepID=A0A5J5GM66_9RHOB|nr:FkbM family methyltransferase [Histidinibacterium aquaticum]KAA9009295.1 FkbM family methyltransferase [Histidinibacterium aquaticum]
MAPQADTGARLAALARHLSPSRRLRVCDVGANPLGEAPYAPLLEAGLAEVHGFEPHPEAYEALTAEDRAGETYYPVAIGRPGARELRIHPNSGFTSLHAFDEASLDRIGKRKWMSPKRPIRIVPLETTALDDVDSLPSIDLLKMDLQGAEGEVVETGGTALADTVAVVTEVRFHRIYEDEPVFGDLDVILRDAGFTLHKFLFTKSVMMPHAHEDKVRRPAMTSQLLDGDAVYLRADRTPAEMDGDALCHLALCADTVFDSPDVTLLALSELERRGEVTGQAADDYVSTLTPRQRARQ